MSKLGSLPQIRRYLHSMPELSGNEAETSKFIIDKINTLKPAGLIEKLGGYGVAAIFRGKNPGPRIMFRSDMDALPIQEINDFPHKSTKAGVGHKCGHDGHMTIMLGLAEKISALHGDFAGEAVMLFQPAEEIAAGAKAIVRDEKFKDIEPDYIFGLHNLPGYPKGSIIARDGVFASASNGFKARLMGETSHAGHPENGRNPVLAMVSLINGLIAIPQMETGFSASALITVIHARLGEEAFGTSPGFAEVMATFRSHTNEDMEKMSTAALHLTGKLAEAHKLDYETEWVEVFPAMLNDDKCVKLIRDSARSLGVEIVNKPEPFPWSEDFAYYTENYRGGFFGLGAGVDTRQLHNPDYDFPDELLDSGVNIFYEIFSKLLKDFK